MSSPGRVASRVNAENFADIQAVLSAYKKPKGKLPLGSELSAPQRTAIARELNQKLGVKTFTPDTVKELLDGWTKIAAKISKQAKHQDEVNEGVGRTLDMSRASGAQNARRGSGAVSLQVREAQRASGGISLSSMTRGRLGSVVSAAMLAVALGTGAMSFMPSVAHAQTAQHVGAAHDPTTTAASARSAADILKRWSPDQHVWTIGDMRKETSDVGTIRFTPAQLAAIEQELDAKGKNWTVVFVETGTLERDGDFTNTATTKELSVGLANHPGFSGLTDPRTGQKNGNLLVITFNAKTDEGQRTNIAYFGGAEYDARGLGEEHWTGDLDQAFGNAWNNGYNLNEGVLGSVRAIEGKLTGGIEAEQRAAAARLAEAQGAVRDVGAQLDGLANAATRFKQDHPQATGSLVTPDLATLRAGLVSAEKALGAGDVAGATNAARGVGAQVGTLNGTYEAAQNAPATFKRLTSDVAAARADKLAGAGEAHFKDAEKHMGAAGTALDVGNPSFAGELDSARASLQKGVDEVGSAHTAQNAKRLGLLFGILGLLGLGTILKLRSRARGKDARQKLDTLESGLKQKVADLLKFNKESSIQIGSDPKAAREMYDGKTEDMAVSILADLRDLLVFRSEMEKRVAEAKPLVEGKGMKWLVNQFWPSNYDKAMAVLSNEVFKYEPGDRVVIAIEGVQNGNDWLKEFTKSVGDMQSFELTFDKLMVEFDVRTKRMAESYKTITGAELSAKGTLDGYGTDAGALEASVNELNAKGAGDGLFVLPAVVADVVPAVRANVAAASTQRVKDPVGALEGPGAEANRKLGDGNALAKIATDGRDMLLPHAGSTKTKLTAHGVRVAWVDQRLAGLSQEAQKLGGTIAKKDSGEPIAALGLDLLAARNQLTAAVALDERRVGPSRTSIDTLVTTIASGRADIGRALGRDAGTVLREVNEDPSTRVDEGEQQIAAAKGHLDVGAVDETKTTLDEVARQVDDANRIVRRSREILGSHPQDVAARETEGDRLDTLTGEREALYGTLRGEYAANRLDDLRGVAGQAKKSLEQARGDVRSAQTAYKGAQLLGSDALIEKAKATQAGVQTSLDGITGRQAQLQSEDAANQTALQTLESSARSMATEAADSRTRAPARRDASSAEASLTAVRRTVGAKGRDPASVAQNLAETQRDVTRARDAIQSDWQAHAAASNAIGRAANRVDDRVSGEGYSGNGSAGAGDLATARQRLQNGDYEGAKSAADSSYSKADSAIDTASAEISRRRRAREAEEAAAARRAAAARAAAASRSSGSSSSSFSGGSGSRSSNFK